MFHCFVPQHTLDSKSGIIKECMEVAIKIINIVKGDQNALNNRLFKTFLIEFGSDHSDLFLHNEFRWLSAGSFFFEIKSD